MIDVLLVLLIFFMVSTTFNQEGRVKVQLPQSSDTPMPRGSREPLVITVTAEGAYRVNERTLINSSPDTLRAALLKEAGHGSRAHHDSRRRAHHASGGGDRHGCGGHTWDSRNSTSPRSMRTRRLERSAGAGLKPAGDSWSIYRRLIKYAKPYAGMYF